MLTHAFSKSEVEKMIVHGGYRADRKVHNTKQQEKKAENIKSK